MFTTLLKTIQKHNLNYFLICGSMLGAQRHNGFIPWDDDLDVGLPDEDYKKLLEILREEIPEDMVVQNYLSDKNSPILFTKIRLLSTKFIEKKAKRLKNEYNGIFIDIFPINGCGNDYKKAIKHCRTLRIIRRMYTLSQVNWHEEKISLIKRIILLVGRVLLFAIPPKLIASFYEKKASKYSFYSSDYAANYHTVTPELMRKDVYYSDQTDSSVLFENVLIKGVSKPNEYLSIVYGDWRTLPNIEKRVNTHDPESIDFGKYN